MVIPSSRVQKESVKCCRYRYEKCSPYRRSKVTNLGELVDGWMVGRLRGCEVAGLGDWGPQIWVSTNE